MPNLACVKCMKEMSDMGAVEACQIVKDAEPFIVWEAVLFKCPRCGMEILGDFESRLSSHYHKDDVSAEYWFEEEL